MDDAEERSYPPCGEPSSEPPPTSYRRGEEGIEFT